MKENPTQPVEVRETLLAMDKIQEAIEMIVSDVEKSNEQFEWMREQQKSMEAVRKSQKIQQERNMKK